MSGRIGRPRDWVRTLADWLGSAMKPREEYGVAESMLGPPGRILWVQKTHSREGSGWSWRETSGLGDYYTSRKLRTAGAVKARIGVFGPTLSAGRQRTHISETARLDEALVDCNMEVDRHGSEWNGNGCYPVTTDGDQQISRGLANFFSFSRFSSGFRQFGPAGRSWPGAHRTEPGSIPPEAGPDPARRAS